MVDFHEENAHLYIPKNLSYENYDYLPLQRRKDSLRIRALQLSKRDRRLRKELAKELFKYSLELKQSVCDNIIVEQGKTISSLDLASYFRRSFEVQGQEGSVRNNLLFTSNFDDWNRVTINFDNKNMDTLLQDNNTDGDKDEKCVINGPSVNSTNEDSAENSSSPLLKKRLKEKELPKIKLLLSQSPTSVSYLESQLSGKYEEEEERTRENEVSVVSSGSLCMDKEFDFLDKDKVKRSTSLKTYKTPPGTPNRKKVVRFADAMGLDLEDVKTVMNLEDPPTIPDSAMKDLKIGLEEEHKTEGTKHFTTCFPQPGASPNFIHRIKDNKVMLENCLVDGSDMSICGTVRVANIAYHKRVTVRFSVNNWMTFTDVQASYVQNSNDVATDRFSFTIGIPNYFQIGDKLQFAITYRANGQEYWDSNGGSNYVIECFAAAIPVSESDNTWMNFL